MDFVKLASCPALQQQWHELERLIAQKLVKAANKLMAPKQVPPQALEIALFEYKDEALPLLKQRNRAELIKRHHLYDYPKQTKS